MLNNRETLIVESALTAAYDHLHSGDGDSPRRRAFMLIGLKAAEVTNEKLQQPLSWKGKLATCPCCQSA